MRETAVGLLVGVFDLFNVEHLEALVSAAGRCDHLVVGVVSDDLAVATGRRRPFVPEPERVQIVGAVTGVRRADLVTDLRTAAATTAATGAGVIFTLDGEGLADDVRAATEIPVVPLAAGRATASVAVRAALAGSTGRSSVA
jgi:glycerol-3-phosphate cytidylyltransferase